MLFLVSVFLFEFLEIGLGLVIGLMLGLSGFIDLFLVFVLFLGLNIDFDELSVLL